VALTWTTGTRQSGYRLVRTDAVTLHSVLLPAAGAPRAGATSFLDRSPLDLGCYVLLPLGRGDILGPSDELYAATTRTGTPPANFTPRLNQSSTAGLFWSAPAGASGYALIAAPLDGSPVRTSILGSTTTSMTDTNSGIPTCYVVFASGVAANARGVLGAIPGAATVTTVATAAGPGAVTDGGARPAVAAAHAATSTPVEVVRDTFRRPQEHRGDRRSGR
jgi:hypothetical protein